MILGVVVPKQYIPAIELGVKGQCVEGSLGFLVIDISINLFDSKYHAVNSFDWAFRKAGMAGMRSWPICTIQNTLT